MEPERKICGSCVAETAEDCGGLIWGALVVQHDNPVMPEDYDPVPPGPEPCSCECHVVFDPLRGLLSEITTELEAAERHDPGRGGQHVGTAPLLSGARPSVRAWLERLVKRYGEIT